MTLGSRQLRGWKEIAVHLNVSERSAKRWEKSRKLPVHRVTGLSRDAVFARVDELDAWLQADAGEFRQDGLNSESPEDGTRAIPRQMNSRVGSRAKHANVLAVAAAFALLTVSLIPHVSRTSRSSALNAESRSSVFRIAVDNWTTKVTILEGGCGDVELKQEIRVRLCPRTDGDSLLLTILPPLSRPTGGRDPKPFTVRVRRDAETRIMDPLPFDLEWIGQNVVPRPRSDPKSGR